MATAKDKAAKATKANRRSATARAKRLAGFPSAAPQTANLDKADLARFRKALTHESETLRSLAGAAHVILHCGKCVFACASGLADRTRGTRFTTRTLCKLHGATKPLVATAFLALVDAGKCCLADPVAKYLPFSDKVTASGGKRGPCARQPTLRDLLTMTAGLGDESAPAYRGLMRLVRSGKIADLKCFCDAVAEKPLQAQPGKRYQYSFAYEFLGRVCEIISDLSLEDFMRKWLLDPLGMKDTHFVVPAHKLKRCAALYDAKPLKRKRQDGAEYGLTPYRHLEKAPMIQSGGGGILSYHDAGMWGTAQDYARFCSMLISGGISPDGRRVLKTSTARALWNDALGPLGGRDGRLLGWHDSDGAEKGGWWDYRGLSLNHAFLDLDETPRRGRTRRSRSMWFSGGGGAFWTIDARRGLTTVSMSQTFGGRVDESDDHGPLAYRIGAYLE